MKPLLNNINYKHFYFSTSEIVKSNQKKQYYITHSNEIATIEIYQINGQKLRSSIYKNNPFIQLNFENYPNGLYFILAFDETNRKKVFKIILE